MYSTTSENNATIDTAIRNYCYGDYTAFGVHKSKKAELSLQELGTKKFKETYCNYYGWIMFRFIDTNTLKKNAKEKGYIDIVGFIDKLLSRIKDNVLFSEDGKTLLKFTSDFSKKHIKFTTVLNLSETLPFTALKK